MDQLKSPSYMELRIDMDGKPPLYLRVPTFWDSIKNEWMGAIKLPISLKIIHAYGKDSFELQNNFNKVLYELFESEYKDEVLSMFQPLR